MTIPATISSVLAKLLPRLASNHDGEVVATARAIERVLKTKGHDFHDLAAALCRPVRPLPETDWRREARFCAGKAEQLSDRELDLLATLARWRGQPTDKQLKWLHDITARLRT